MERAEIEEKILSIIRREKEIPAEISRDTPLSEAGIDSLDSLNILFGIEETFGISVPDEQARSIRTLEDMVATVEGLTTAEK